LPTSSGSSEPTRHPGPGDYYRFFNNDTVIRVLYHMKDVNRANARVGVAFIFTNRPNDLPMFEHLTRFSQVLDSGVPRWRRCDAAGTLTPLD